jgi:hypothetical protein
MWRLILAGLAHARSEECAEGTAYCYGRQSCAVAFEREQQGGYAACGEEKGTEREIAIVVSHGWDRRLDAAARNCSKAIPRGNAICVTVS